MRRTRSAARRSECPREHWRSPEFLSLENTFSDLGAALGLRRSWSEDAEPIFEGEVRPAGQHAEKSHVAQLVALRLWLVTHRGQHVRRCLPDELTHPLVLGRTCGTHLLSALCCYSESRHRGRDLFAKSRIPRATD